MSCDYGIPSLLLRFLSACVYGDAGAFYAGLGESDRAELEEQGKSFGMSAWFYRYLHDSLPEGRRAEYQKAYHARQVNAMMGGHELKRLYRVLAVHGLRFVPVKGADFAYRLYPDAALRLFGDWDIWFHPDDCERALAVLADDGWIIPGHYSDQNGAALKIAEHHFSPHGRGQYTLEPHFSLANFRDADQYEMWECTQECPGGDGQRVLSPEMNLLMLTRHAATKSYYHVQIPKLLVDAAMVMRKDQVDFGLLRKLAARWHLPYPGDLFAAFPEFFPPAVLEGFCADQMRAAEFRRLFEIRGKMGKQENVSLVLSRYAAKGFVVGGALKHIRLHDVSMMRRIYRLPKKGAWGRVIWSYVCWFCARGWRAVLWLRTNRDLEGYSRLVELIESDSFCPSTQPVSPKQ